MRILSRFFFDSEPTFETIAYICMLLTMAIGAAGFWMAVIL